MQSLRNWLFKVAPQFKAEPAVPQTTHQSVIDQARAAIDRNAQLVARTEALINQYKGE